MLPCARDVISFVIFTCLGVFAYACCYHLLAELHHRTAGAYATLMAYGFVQYVIGYLAGYVAARLIYYYNTPNERFTVEEMIPIINHRAVDSEEEIRA